jgi:hypothetical protein
MKSMNTTDALMKAFKDCELDCCDWSDEALRELAIVAIAGLQKAGYQFYEYNPHTTLVVEACDLKIEKSTVTNS